MRLALILFFERIVLQVATQAVAQMPGLLFFPVLPAAATTALVFWWIFISVYIYGSGGHLTHMREYNTHGNGRCTCLGAFFLSYTCLGLAKP